METDYFNRDYDGVPHFQCARCPFDSFDEDRMRRHISDRHPSPPEGAVNRELASGPAPAEKEPPAGGDRKFATAEAPHEESAQEPPSEDEASASDASDKGDQEQAEGRPPARSKSERRR
jgi:hypothetical protein